MARSVDTSNVEDIAAGLGPKSQGQVQGFLQVLQASERELAAIRERLTAEEGIKKGAATTAEVIQGMMAPVQKAVKAETMSVEEAKIRRDTILGARTLATQVADKAGREALLLKGEARALGRQVDTIRKLYHGLLEAERRKERMAAEMDEDRARRAVKPVEEPPAKEPAPGSAKPKAKAKSKAKGKGKGKAKAGETTSITEPGQPSASEAGPAPAPAPAPAMEPPQPLQEKQAAQPVQAVAKKRPGTPHPAVGARLGKK